ncbi:hypothetical protein AB0F13_24025 [Streptomyces sp. NPDC026206]|uniref:hypothetical protein n=1 Tax=Streptomyces sp. NPDC026206 TaxID=3157089 RepID=UPI00340054FF
MIDSNTHTDVLAKMERDYVAWLEQGGLSRMAQWDGRDLTDPGVFAEAVGEPVLEPHRAALAGDDGVRWANLLAAFIEAVHSGTLDALEAETAAMAASLDGGHAGGCG